MIAARVMLLSALLALCGLADATSVRPMPLDEMVSRADYVLVATVVKVDMVNGRGWAVSDPEARTGPGSENQIRLHLRADDILKSKRIVPRTVIVPLWKMWHYSLGSIREQVEGTRGIFLLKGNDFQPAYPAGFQRGLEEREQIERLLLDARLKN
jgi:hypothetical protein